MEGRSIKIQERINYHTWIGYDKEKEIQVVFHLVDYMYIQPQNDTKEFYRNSFIYSMNGLVKIFKIIKPDEDPRLIRYICRRDIDPSSVLIQTEYMVNGYFYDHISKYLLSDNKNNEVINPTIRSKIIYGVAAIMNRLHKNNIMHIDFLKQIYLNERFEPKIQLTNLSFMINKTLEQKIEIGNTTQADFILPFISSPEFVTDDEPSFSSDVFAFAFFLYLMFVPNIQMGSKVFKLNSKDSNTMGHLFYNCIQSGERPPLSESIPDEYKNLIQKCWCHEPLCRPTFEQIVEELRNDKFALTEFGMETDLDELHSYRERIDKDVDEGLSQ